ncbi:hypothetical protein FHW03_004242 [Ochrobactrum sp. RH2CCR150]|nr:hypothetical protein [Ochrobactrum sp. RH2CCR150]
MKNAHWINSALGGAIVSAIATMVVGFTFGGWVIRPGQAVGRGRRALRSPQGIALRLLKRFRASAIVQ